MTKYILILQKYNIETDEYESSSSTHETKEDMLFEIKLRRQLDWWINEHHDEWQIFYEAFDDFWDFYLEHIKPHAVFRYKSFYDSYEVVEDDEEEK